MMARSSTRHAGQRDAQHRRDDDAEEDHAAAEAGQPGRGHADDDGVVAGQHHVDDDDREQRADRAPFEGKFHAASQVRPRACHCQAGRGPR